MSKNKVPENVWELFEGHCAHQKEKLEEELQDLFDLLKVCESPLEQMLLLEFADVFDAKPRGAVEERHLRGLLIFPNVDRFSIAIRQQHVVSTHRKSYRADFCITVEDWNWKEGKHDQLVKMIVEVDGHDFHEKTKEQAQRDKSRDRHMTADGYMVLRFTGREVFRDTSEVASEIESILIEQATKLL
jgi:very-short-patch-repair endonuclease